MKGDELRQKRNSLSSTIGSLIKDNKTDEVEKIKTEVSNINAELAEIEKNPIKSNEEKRLLSLKEYLKKDISENDKMEVLLNLLFSKEERKLYRERYISTIEKLKEYVTVD